MTPTLTVSPNPATPGSTLDEAWAEAESVLPEGWHVGELKSVAYRGEGERWMAMAWSFSDDPDYMTFLHGYGDTPVESLQALTARARRDKEPTNG